MYVCTEQKRRMCVSVCVHRTLKKAGSKKKSRNKSMKQFVYRTEKAGRRTVGMRTDADDVCVFRVKTKKDVHVFRARMYVCIDERGCMCL